MAHHHHALGGQPCPSLAHFASEWMVTKRREWLRPWHKSRARRSRIWAPSAHARVILTRASGQCRRQPTTASFSTQPGLGARGHLHGTQLTQDELGPEIAHERTDPPAQGRPPRPAPVMAQMPRRTATRQGGSMKCPQRARPRRESPRRQRPA